MTARVTLKVAPAVLAERMALGPGRMIIGARWDWETYTVVLDVVAGDAPPEATEMAPTFQTHRCPGGHRNCDGRIEMVDPGWRS